MTTENMSDEYEAPELNEVGPIRKVTQGNSFSLDFDGFLPVGADTTHQGNSGHHGS